MISRGSCLVLVSQVIAVIVHSFAKILETTNEIDPQQILQVRMFLTLSINSILLTTWWPEELPLGHHRIRGLLTLRAFGGVCGSVGFYYSLQYLPLADATILNLLAPLGASFLISKRFSLIRIGSAIVCILGVGLIAKPSFVVDLIHHVTRSQHLVSSPTSADNLSHVDWRGFMFAMIGVIGGVCSYFSISKIGARAHPLATTNCFATGILLTSSVSFATIPGVKYNFNMGFLQWSLLLLIGLCGALMEYFFTAGLAATEDGSAVYMTYLQTVFALVADVVVWRRIPDILSVIGSLLIIVALVITERSKEEEVEEKDFAHIEMRFHQTRFS